jgi:hypothetical protein
MKCNREAFELKLIYWVAKQATHCLLDNEGDQQISKHASRLKNHEKLLRGWAQIYQRHLHQEKKETNVNITTLTEQTFLISQLRTTAKEREV